MFFFISLVNAYKLYDFIVVGGGSSGGIVAYELAKSGFSTLLIEAGPQEMNANITTPIMHLRASEDEKITWEYYVNLFKSGTRQNVYYPRVGALGGCSLHNAMVAMYPNKVDFDNMVKWTKNHEFSEREMRKIFREMETNNYPIFAKTEDHGFETYGSGMGQNWFPISYVSLLRQLTLDPQFLGVLLNLKGNPLHDANGRIDGVLGADLEGRIFVPINVDKNYERGNFQNHILEAKENFGLDIWTDTLVTKILINPQTRVATGVRFKRGKYLYKASPLLKENYGPLLNEETVYAKNEIILSAGTFNTPQLLMLSGIGPEKDLRSMGINTIVNLPGVGKNLQDRYEVAYITKYNRDFSLIKNCLFKTDMSDPCYRKYQNRLGAYVSNGLLSAEISKSKYSEFTPDVMTVNVAGRFNGYYKGYSDTVTRHLNEITQLIIKARTSNHGGTVELKNSDPTEPPIINFNSFSDNPTTLNEDLNAIVDQLKLLRRTRGGFLDRGWEFMPGERYQTDEQLRNYVIQNMWGHHACCSAKIGFDNDPYSVLNQDFFVRGIRNLRVMDMSVFPEIPGFFPVVYLQMMATKVARMIIRDYK